MPFKWKKIWPRTYALKATPFAAELEEIIGLASWLFRAREFSNQRR